MKDRLWFYAGLAAELNYDARTGFYRSPGCEPQDPGRAALDSNGMFAMQGIPGTEFVYGSGTSRDLRRRQTHLAGGRESQLLRELQHQANVEGGKFGVNGAPAATYSTSSYNTTNVVVGYGGKLLDKHLLLEANLGWLEWPFSPRTKTINGVDQALTPRIGWGTPAAAPNFNPLLAASSPYGEPPGGHRRRAGLLRPALPDGRSGGIRENTTERSRRDGLGNGILNLLGQHMLKGGVRIDYAEYNGTQGIYSRNRPTRHGAGSSVRVFPEPEGSFNAFQMTTVRAGGNPAGASSREPARRSIQTGARAWWMASA